MDFAALKQKRDEYEAAIKEHGKAALVNEMKGLFEKFQDVGSVRWTQYTPHFNDGEPCVFSVYFEGTLDVGEPARDDDEYEYNYGRESFTAFRKLVEEAEEVLEEAFGDGSKVTVHRDGRVEVDEYEHD
jgi:hypothetical protein